MGRVDVQGARGTGMRKEERGQTYGCSSTNLVMSYTLSWITT